MATLLVRVPLDSLSDAGFVASRREIDRDASAAAIDRLLANIQSWIVLERDGRRVGAAHARARLSLPSDRSFDSYDEARAHLERPPLPLEAVFVDQGFFDAVLIHPIGDARTPADRTVSAAPRLSVRLLANERFTPRARLTLGVVRETGGVRSLPLTSGSGLVALEPTSSETTSWFVRSGVRAAWTNARFLLAAVVLALGAKSAVWPVVALFSTGRSAAVVGTAFGLNGLQPSVEPFIDLAASTAVLLVALTLAAGTALERHPGAVGLLGLVLGLAFSFALREALPLAGGHDLAAVLAFNLGIEIGQLVPVMAGAVVVRSMAARATERRAAWGHDTIGEAGHGTIAEEVEGRRREVLQTATLLLAVHLAWHAALDRGRAIWPLDLSRVDATSAMVLARWLAGACVFVVAVRYVRRRLA